MLRRVGSTRQVYRTTFVQGVQWSRDRRRMGAFSRLLRGAAELLSKVGRTLVGGIAMLFAVVIGLAHRLTGGSGQRRLPQATVVSEPITGSGITARRADRYRSETITAVELPFMLRIAAVSMGILLLAGGVVAIPAIRTMVLSNDVVLVDEGISVEITTMASTVGELIDSYGIRLIEGDIVYPERSEPLKEGTQVMVRRAMNVTTNADGVARDLRIQAGTVRDALAISGIDYDVNDLIEPSLSAKLTPGMNIDITRVEQEKVFETERIYFREIVQKDKELYVGTREVAQVGSEGKKELEIQVVYHDGEEVSRDVVGERILEAPVHRIVKEGTKEKPKATPKPTAKPKNTEKKAEPAKAAAAKAADKETLKVTDTAVLYNGKSYEIKETDRFMITAYTHTGRKTSTGTWPKVGTIAVDPKVIPYGTYLYVPGYGIGKAADTGPSDKHLDLFFDTYEECIQYGRKRNIKVYILEKPKAIN